MQQPAQAARAWPGWVPSELVEAICADSDEPLDIGSTEHLLFVECLNATIHADDWGVHGSRRVFVDFLFDRVGMLLRGSGQSRVDPPPDGTDSPLMHALTARPFAHHLVKVGRSAPLGSCPAPRHETNRSGHGVCPGSRSVRRCQLVVVLGLHTPTHE